jgi:hypothetical protein
MAGCSRQVNATATHLGAVAPVLLQALLQRLDVARAQLLLQLLLLLLLLLLGLCG